MATTKTEILCFGMLLFDWRENERKKENKTKHTHKTKQKSTTATRTTARFTDEDSQGRVPYYVLNLCHMYLASDWIRNVHF